MITCVQSHTRVAAVAIGLFGLAWSGLSPSEAATTFNRSTVLNVDDARRTITIRTQEGDTWTLSVSDPDLLKDKHIAQGDRVSIDIDFDDRVTKIVELSDQPPQVPTQSEDRP